MEEKIDANVRTVMLMIGLMILMKWNKREGKARKSSDGILWKMKGMNYKWCGCIIILFNSMASWIKKQKKKKKTQRHTISFHWIRQIKGEKCVQKWVKARKLGNTERNKRTTNWIDRILQYQRNDTMWCYFLLCIDCSRVVLVFCSRLSPICRSNNNLFDSVAHAQIGIAITYRLALDGMHQFNRPQNAIDTDA